MLCLVTQRSAVLHGNLIDLIRSLKKTQICRLILREKDLPQEELIPYARAIKKVLKDSETQLMINTEVEVARAIDACGVHFPFDIFKNTSERYGLTGVSVHSVEEARYAEAKGADYLVAGHIYPTACKEGLAPRGLSYLKSICDSVSLPVIAIGGIQPRHVPDVIKQGAEGIAVMSTINRAVNPVQRVFEYQAALKVFRNA